MTRQSVSVKPRSKTTTTAGRAATRRVVKVLGGQAVLVWPVGCALLGKPPVSGDTTPRHEPGTGRDQSRNTPLGGVAWDNPLGVGSREPQGHT